MKKIFFTLMLAFACMSAYAQKPVVLVDWFYAADGVAEAHEEALRGAVIANIDRIGRLQLVDVESQYTMDREAQRRATEAAMADPTARAGEMKTTGAQYLLTGNISKMDAVYKVPTDGTSPYWAGAIVYSLTIINAADGTTVGTKSYTYEGLTGNTGSTKDEAIVSTIKKTKQSMDDFVNEFFPLKGAIVELGEGKGAKVKTCYINLGTDHGITAKQKLDVFQVKSIAGRETENAIAVLTVAEVVAPDLALCNVTSGAKEVYEAFQAGAEMRVKTKKDSAVGSALKGFFAM